MRYQKVLSRRTLLRGAGSVAIALPFLDEMRSTSVWAAEPEPPARAFNIFFGLGVPKEVAALGWTGALAPLAAFADKLALVRGVNQYEGDGPGNNHFDGGGAAFTAAEPPTVSVSGGASIDQVMRREMYPGGVDTLVGTLMMGTFFRRKLEADLSLTRFVHCWNQDGTPVDVPIETPEDLFDRVFGEAPPDNPDDLKARHYDQSVLDSVVGQYQHYSSDNGGLGGSSKAKLADHLEKVRELEKKLFPDGELSCDAPDAPAGLPLLNGQEVDAGGGGPVIDPLEWTAYWQALADIWAMGVKCDVTRFGQALFQSGGERVQLVGPGTYDGQAIAFDDVNDPIGVGGSHEYWHNYSASASNTELHWHTYYIMEQLAYLLGALDDDTYPDENGQTILDNALITISTELGDGSPHNLESVFHAVSGANDRVQPGIYDVNASGTDLYRTLLNSYGIDDTLIGTQSAFNGHLSQILV